MPSPIIVSLGDVHIHWYGLILAVSLLLGHSVARTAGALYGFSAKTIDAVVVGTAIAGFLGARVYHILNDFSYYAAHPLKIVAVWEGGLAIHGALIGGFIYLVWYARQNRARLARKPVASLCDVLAPAVLLGQALGRWGNYFNQELFGRPTRMMWGIHIDPQYRPWAYSSFSTFHPVFFYEFLWDGVSFLVLLYVVRRVYSKKRIHGIVGAMYLLLYGVGRVFVELIRVDTVPIVGGVRLPLIVGGILALAGCAWILKIIRFRGSSTI